MQDETADLVKVNDNTQLQQSIDGMSGGLRQYLSSLSLPSDGILHSVENRWIIIDQFASVISILPIEQRAKSEYLTKFVVAIAAGLFDGALNYLWNETISAIRGMVIRFDGTYFLNIAQTVDVKNKNVTIEDLHRISDHDLLETSRRIGLLSDVNYKRLEQINYMRNHASAAHPNDNPIDAYEVLSWIRICIQHAIIAEPDHSVIQIKRLLDNIRRQVFQLDDASAVGVDIVKQPQERIDDLTSALFGMFTDVSLASTTRANIKLVAKDIWVATSQTRKLEIGSKYGTFRKNGEVDRKTLANEYLQVVDGTQFRDEDSLSGELLEKLDTLKRVHFANGNFYNEYPHAKSLSSSLPNTGLVPRSARAAWVKVIALCFVGNGLGYREGVDEAALPYYDVFVNAFTEAESIEFAHLFVDNEFNSELRNMKPDRRVRQLASIIKSKYSNILLHRVLDLIIGAPPLSLEKLSITSDYKKAISHLPKQT